MAIKKDILLGDDNDLIIENGDFKMGDGTLQHQLHIIRERPGERKQYPEVGAAAEDDLNATNPKHLIRKIIRQLKHDVFRVLFVGTAKNGNLIVDAYEKD